MDSRHSLDHLAGNGEHHRRNFKPKRLGAALFISTPSRCTRSKMSGGKTLIPLDGFNVDPENKRVIGGRFNSSAARDRQAK